MKINISETDKVQAALNVENGKATTFTIYRPDQVAHIVVMAAAALRKAGITEAESNGTVVTYRPAGPWASAYKNSAISTLVTLKKTGSGWF